MNKKQYDFNAKISLSKNDCFPSNSLKKYYYNDAYHSIRIRILIYTYYTYLLLIYICEYYGAQ